MRNRIYPKWRFVLIVFIILGLSVTISQMKKEEPDSSSHHAFESILPAVEGSTPEQQVPIKPMSQHIVEYHIHVKLDENEKSLHGNQTLTWINPGEQPVRELYFHLYPNAFQSDKTSFIRESGGKLRNDKMKKGGYGSMQITTLKTSDGIDLHHHMQYVQPDDGNKDDQTLMKVSLHEPVLPGNKITLHMQFEVKLPPVFARMGYAGDFVMAGQWFPKVAVYETKGTRGRADEGWNIHQYHGNSEFYSNFGIYSVRIDVPKSYIVAATGFPTKKTTIHHERKTVHFYADNVHDFAWAASPHFQYVEEPFSAPQVPGVKIKLYLDPKHAHLQERYLLAAKKSLDRFSEWYGTYPYSTLSIVVPPAGANGAGGMEYPTLITAWAAEDEHPGFELERVLVHEIGHQYWYGMVASNEFEEAWLDEGFTSYAEDKLMELEYGIRTNTPLEASYITSPAPLKQWSWKYHDHSQYADNVYIRAKLLLKDIERIIGSEQMEHVLRSYFQQWKFRHPSTQDFQQILTEVTGRNWDDYFQQFVYHDRMLDYAVESIQVKEVERQGTTVYENKVYIRNYGGKHQPVPIQFYFENGEEIRKEWDGKKEQAEFTIIHAAPLKWVAVDPEFTMILENKHMNNYMKTNVATKDKVRWNLGIVKMMETFIGRVAW